MNPFQKGDRVEWSSPWSKPDPRRNDPIPCGTVLRVQGRRIVVRYDNGGIAEGSFRSFRLAKGETR